MKSTPIKLILTGLLLAVLAIFISAFSAEQANDKYLTVWTITNLEKMIIVDENGAVEESKLEGYGGKGAVAAALKVTQTFNTIAHKGYQLMSASGDVYVRTYVFVKK